MPIVVSSTGALGPHGEQFLDKAQKSLARFSGPAAPTVAELARLLGVYLAADLRIRAFAPGIGQLGGLADGKRPASAARQAMSPGGTWR